MATCNRQYRPLADQEVTTNSSVNPRTLRDQCDNTNNYFAHLASFKIVSELWIPELESTASDEEIFRAVFGPFWVPASTHYTFHAWINGYLSTGTPSSDYTDWRVYISDTIYKGPQSFDSRYLNHYDFYYKRITSATRNANPIGIELGRSASDTPMEKTDQDIYVYLTSWNNDAATRSKVVSIDVQLHKGDS